jgi:hypothetical protein
MDENTNSVFIVKEMEIMYSGLLGYNVVSYSDFRRFGRKNSLYLQLFMVQAKVYYS